MYTHTLITQAVNGCLGKTYYMDMTLKDIAGVALELKCVVENNLIRVS